MPDASDRSAAPAARDGYTVGYGKATLNALQQRTLATCARFFLPHLHPTMVVLDCGCGPGSMTLEIAERVDPGQVVGLDRDEQQVVAARSLAAERGVANARFEVGDVYALPFPDDTFDAVFSHALVSHLREPERAFSEMRRALKPGGVLAVAENDNGTWVISPADSAMERLASLFQQALDHNGGNRLLMRHVRGALLAAGFTAVEAHAGAEVWGTPAAVRDMAAAMGALAQGPGFVGPVLEQGWASSAEVEALPAELLAWGELPDAYVAVLKPGALGWKPRE